MILPDASLICNDCVHLRVTTPEDGAYVWSCSVLHLDGVPLYVHAGDSEEMMPLYINRPDSCARQILYRDARNV